MRGKRKLCKIEVLSNEATHAYEYDTCAWMINVPSGAGLSEIEIEFDGMTARKIPGRRNPLGITARRKDRRDHE
jgi:hypothetical protein